MKRYLAAALPANLCFLIPGLDGEHSYSLENLNCFITKSGKRWISLAGGAWTEKIYSVGTSGLISRWNSNRRHLVFRGTRCWHVQVEAVLGGGCLTSAGLMPGALFGGMVPGAPVPGEGRWVQEKGIDLNETSARWEAIAWHLLGGFGGSWAGLLLLVPSPLTFLQDCSWRKVCREQRAETADFILTAFSSSQEK